MPFRSTGQGARGLLERDVRIRAASVEDSRFLAEVILLASRAHVARGFWDLLLQAPDDLRLDFIELLTLLEHRSYCHYGGFLLAEGEAGPIAALSGYDPGEAGLVSPGHLIALGFGEYGWSEDRLVSAYARVDPFNVCFPPQRAGVWTIEWVATIPRFRRKGVISLLLDRVLDLGRESGFREAQLTSFVGNAAAEGAYLKAGFRPTERREHPQFERLTGASGLMRYERRL